MGRENEETWKRHCDGSDDDSLFLRFKRLRFIENHIGEDVLCNDPIVANGMALLRNGTADIDEGMALLCRTLSIGMRRYDPILIYGVSTKAKAADSFEPGDIAFWNDRGELVKQSMKSVPPLDNNSIPVAVIRSKPFMQFDEDDPDYDGAEKYEPKE